MCDLDDVIGMVQTSTQFQEQKAESLEAFSQKTEEFAAESMRNYLKLDAEKCDREELKLYPVHR